MRRRPLLIASAAAPLAARAAEPLASDDEAPVRRGRALVFPRDHGAHARARIEWWYVTGWLYVAGSAAPEPAYGFQLTFFRARGVDAGGNTRRFAATQLLFAHAALSDLGAKRATHDERIARAGFGIAEASPWDTDVVLRGWTFARGDRSGGSRYTTKLDALERAGFAFDFAFDTTQPLLLQGDAGWSRKGPKPAQSSHYYSQPQMAVSGTLARRGAAPLAVAGRAWLDHEWSDEILDASAVGWDWIGINLLDGGALTAFRLRRADGSALWAGGSVRAAGGSVRAFGEDEVRFTPGRAWTSPATATRYPVEWSIETPAGRHRVRALLDAQELDSRSSTGTIYWEGLAELLDERDARIGLGYLELTGYAARMRL